VNDLQALTAELLNKAENDKNIIGTAATDYLHVVGYTGMAFMWARIAKAAMEKTSSDAYFESKIRTARYYFTRILPRINSLIITAASTSDVMFDIKDELF
jgi:hypothetical protein